MNVKFCLAFPCEAVSVPVMRRVLGDTLRNLGVVDDCIGDILVAVTEACTNVLRHSGPTRRYEVVTSVGRSGCQVEVVDSGLGLGRRGEALARGDANGANGRRPGPDSPASDSLPGHAAERVRPRGGAGHAEDLTRGTDPARVRHRYPQQQRPRQGAPAAAGRPGRPMPPARRPEDQIIARLPESGRGLQIMRALVDDVTLQSGPGRGTVVSMRKRVAWRHDAPLVGMSDRRLRDAG